MKWLLLIRPRAEADLAKARSRYDKTRPDLGDDFLDEVAAALRKIETDPERPMIYYRGFHRVITRRFPYKIFYQVEGHRVIVFRVLHGHQNHPQWLGK